MIASVFQSKLFSVAHTGDVPIIKEKACKYAKPDEFLMKLESPLGRYINF